MAKNFVSVPKEVEAYQWFAPANVIRHRPIAGVFESATVPKTYFVITLQNQKVFVNDGEWIITESNERNHYPITDAEFKKNYRPAEESRAANG